MCCWGRLNWNGTELQCTLSVIQQHRLNSQCTLDCYRASYHHARRVLGQCRVFSILRISPLANPRFSPHGCSPTCQLYACADGSCGVDVEVPRSRRRGVSLGIRVLVTEGPRKAPPARGDRLVECRSMSPIKRFESRACMANRK